MKLHLITERFTAYKKFLGSDAGADRLYIWITQKRFQEFWLPDEKDLKGMYDTCLDNPVTRRLWNREHYEPKRAMLVFLDEQPEFIRGMFEDLFNEEKSAEGRCARFSFYCDQLLEAHRENRPKSKLPDHYHGEDYHMISLYLAFRYPERYAPYDFELLRQTLAAFEAPQLPRANDLERYFKLMRTLLKLMQKDEELIAKHRARLDPESHYMGESLLLPYDFSRFVTGI